MPLEYYFMLAGLVLLLIEFVVPGFGIFGVSGMVCLPICYPSRRIRIAGLLTQTYRRCFFSEQQYSIKKLASVSSSGVSDTSLHDFSLCDYKNSGKLEL